MVKTHESHSASAETKPLVFIVIFAMLLGLISACSTAYTAPPVRTMHYGSPGRLKAKQVEIGGAYMVSPDYYNNTDDAQHGAGGNIAYGLEDWIQLELGADGAPDGWGMGFLGARFSPLPARWQDSPYKLLTDFELGVGVGAGGVDCPAGSSNCNSWKRAAGGMYVGYGLGVGIHFFDIFIRERFQVSGAEDLPTSMWHSALFGLQGNILQWAKIYLGAGHGFYYNGKNQSESKDDPAFHNHGGFFIETGVAVTIPLEP